MSQAAELTNNIIDFIYRQGNAYAFRVSSMGVYDKRIGSYRTGAKKGISDILACVNGKFVAIEVKIGKDHLSPEQEGFLKNIEHVGGIALVVKAFEDFKQQWKEKVDNFI